jgi:hypothetical protein
MRVIRLGAARGGFADACHLRLEALQLLQVAARAEYEHTAVPVVVAGLHELARPLGVGLLDEARDAKRCTVRRPALDVAVGGLGRACDHAEGCELARVGRGHRRAHRTVERADIADDVVGRQHQQHRIDRVGIASHSLERRVGGERDGGRGVASEGLEHGGARRNAQQSQLLGDQKAVRLVAHHHRRCRREALEAQQRLLQHGARTGERQQLLGIELARQRPQPCTRTAGENDWSEHRLDLATALRPPTAPCRGRWRNR